MKQSFLIKHWFFTLIVGPFLTPLYNFFFMPGENLISGLLELYPIALILSAVLSLPALFLNYLVFILLKKKNVNLRLSKIILIAFVLLAIMVMTILMKGSQAKEIAFTYSVAAIITGYFIELRKTEISESNISISQTL